ncbi:MAG: hypothetical protein EBZ48_11625 [Proteobacteria bacterium]|nr:hypothetical protein [Pseudomonadota bacterium]
MILGNFEEGGITISSAFERRTGMMSCANFGADMCAGSPDCLIPSARCTSQVTKTLPSSVSSFQRGDPWHGGFDTPMNLHIFIVGLELLEFSDMQLLHV